MRDARLAALERQVGAIHDVGANCFKSIISNMQVNIGLCLVGVVIGEFLAARNGLGYLIIYSSQVFKLDWLLMSIVLLCIIAMVLYQGIALLEKWCRKRF